MWHSRDDHCVCGVVSHLCPARGLGWITKRSTVIGEEPHDASVAPPRCVAINHQNWSLHISAVPTRFQHMLHKPFTEFWKQLQRHRPLFIGSTSPVFGNVFDVIFVGRAVTLYHKYTGNLVVVDYHGPSRVEKILTVTRCDLRRPSM